MKHVDEPSSLDEWFMIFGMQELGPQVTSAMDCGSSVKLDVEALDRRISFKHKAEIKAYFKVWINCSSATTPLTNTATQLI